MNCSSEHTYLFYPATCGLFLLDLRGNGQSDRPEEADAYDLETYVGDIQAVVEAAHLDRFALAGLSLGSPIITRYQATHAGGASHLILLSGYASRVQSENYPLGRPREFAEGLIKSWKGHPESTLRGFIEMACSEKYSLRTKELIWEWAHETLPEIWGICFETAAFIDVREDLKNIDIPVLIVHGQDDKLIDVENAEYLQQHLPDARLITIAESGHGFIHTWPQVSRHILSFLKPEAGQYAPSKQAHKSPKILWISSPIGLGHVKRDMAIAAEIRNNIRDLSIHWLAVDPVRSVLAGLDEEIHPLSDALWDESGYFESHSTAYCLNPTEAYWEMDKLLANNFMVFTDAVRETEYDLVIGDESWEVAEYLHYNPSLKTAPFVFMTDFVGTSNVDTDQTNMNHVNNVNGTWVEMRAIHPEASDLSIFIGEPDDIPDSLFGEGLPNRRQWAQKHFRFAGYALPFDPADYTNRQAIRSDLGFSSEDKILLVAVGGTSIGRPLIDKILEALPILKEKTSAIRTIILCGPRIEPESFGRIEGVEFQPFIPDPVKLYASCDLAVIQGGLSTAMELTALARPFLYFPLKNHFEQQHFVKLRLERYKAGMRMDFDNTTPAQLAEAIAGNIGTTANYKPVNGDGAKRAAVMIAELLLKGRE